MPPINNTEKQMNILAPITLASILVASGCANLHNTDRVQGAASPSVAGAHDYQCESGETITAAYSSTDTATVKYKARTYTMQIAISGSGARYVGEGFEWWTKSSGPGSEGLLLRHNADDTTGEILERCKAVPL